MSKSIGLFALLVCLSATFMATVPGADAAVPAAWDWRDVGGVDYLSPVGNISSCSIAYISAPVAMVEARYRIAVTGVGGSLPDVDYSEQHILTCGTGFFGEFGCDGGHCGDVLTHIRDNGVPTESCYNYNAVDADCPDGCLDSIEEMLLHRPVAEVGQESSFPSEADVMQEIYDHGPVATNMDTYEDFYSYAGGVYEHMSGNLAGSTAVLIVGWGDNDGAPHWICRNVWGAGWGDGGDFLIARNALHADCDFGEWVWSCSIDLTGVANEPASWSRMKTMYR